MHDHGKVLHDHATDTFLHKHGSRRLHDHATGEVFRAGKDGTLSSIRSGGDWGGGRHGDWDGDWNHSGRHHRHRHHHHDDDFFFLGLGFGYPFYGFGPYWGHWGLHSPWFWPYYGWGWPYYPGALSFGYASGNFAFLYSTGLSYGWPYYVYDPYCAYPAASYVVDSPAYAEIPESSASIAAAPGAYATDANPGVVVPPSPSTQPEPVASLSAGTSDFAREGEVAFKEKDYRRAIRAWRHALVDDAQNGTLVLMLSQAHFAIGEYAEAAGAVQGGMMLLPPEDWGVVVKNYRDLYRDTQQYVDQLKALEKVIKDKPKEPALRFLTGYHYLYLGYPAESARELKVLRDLAKNDRAGEELLKEAEKELEKKSPQSQAPLPAEPPLAPVER